MPFPKTQRVIYKKNTLAEVACQVNFPAVLSIESGLPAAFQNGIRDQFPLYEEAIVTQGNFKFNVADAANMSSMGFPDINSSSYKEHVFIALDRSSYIKLSRQSLSFVTHKYVNWEAFFEVFSNAFKLLVELYSPVIFERVGIRYINIIDPKALGMSEFQWEELISPEIASVFHDADISKNLLNMDNVMLLGLADDVSLARIITRLVYENTNHNQAFMLDTDLFNEQHNDFEQAVAKLDFLRKRGSRFIQWAITDKLHNHLGPEIVNATKK